MGMISLYHSPPNHLNYEIENEGIHLHQTRLRIFGEQVQMARQIVFRHLDFFCSHWMLGMRWPHLLPILDTDYSFLVGQYPDRLNDEYLSKLQDWNDARGYRLGQGKLPPPPQ